MTIKIPDYLEEYIRKLSKIKKVPMNAIVTEIIANHYIKEQIHFINSIEETIIDSVAKEFGLTPDELKSRTRKIKAPLARQIASHLIKRFTLNTLESTGEVLGGYNHSTIYHNINTIEEHLNSNSPYSRKIKVIYNRILNSLNISE